VLIPREVVAVFTAASEGWGSRNVFQAIFAIAILIGTVRCGNAFVFCFDDVGK